MAFNQYVVIDETPQSIYKVGVLVWYKNAISLKFIAEKVGDKSEFALSRAM